MSIFISALAGLLHSDFLFDGQKAGKVTVV